MAGGFCGVRNVPEGMDGLSRHRHLKVHPFPRDTSHHPRLPLATPRDEESPAKDHSKALREAKAPLCL